MASESKSNAEGMEIVDEEAVLDEYVIAFEELEESPSATAGAYQIFLQNPRIDETALKIKEQCIYKLVRFQKNRIS